MKNTGIILLAAGNSTRMGSAKQLLLYQNKTLLERTIDTALEVFDTNQIILVLGAHYDDIAFSIRNKDIPTIVNKEWDSGMASSITSGLITLSARYPEMEKCFISVCDQPYLTSQVFLEMFQLYKTSGRGIVTAKYADTLGVPALFSKNYFEELMTITGEQGAKKIIQQHREDAETFGFEDGAIDIDTPSDYDNLKNKK